MRQQNNNNSLSVGKASRLYLRLMKAVAAEPVTMAAAMLTCPARTPYCPSEVGSTSEVQGPS